MNSLDYVLVALKLKYGQSLLAMQMQKGAHFLYDDDCDWDSKGNAMGN